MHALGMGDAKAPPKETAKAAHAFEEYYALSSHRSLAKLATRYIKLRF